MIDWHSHILPGMDDGSRDTAESMALIQMQSAQGIDLIIATPHFYANDETLDGFLERRQKAFEELEAQLPEHTPKILLGAEVRYYQGISRMPDLKKLCIQGSRVMLLEMPMCRWTEYMVKELLEMAAMGGIRILLAHIERYLSFQSADVWSQLLNGGILMQVNASFFHPMGTRHKALSLLRRGNIHVIGSDCHNTKYRPPKVERTFRFIEKKLGSDYLRQMDEFGHDLLETAEDPWQIR